MFTSFRGSFHSKSTVVSRCFSLLLKKKTFSFNPRTKLFEAVCLKYHLVWYVEKLSSGWKKKQNKQRKGLFQVPLRPYFRRMRAVRTRETKWQLVFAENSFASHRAQHAHIFRACVFQSSKHLLCVFRYIRIYKARVLHSSKQKWFLSNRPSIQEFFSRSLDSTWCEMSWRHRMRSPENAFSRYAIRWRHEVSHQVGWARRERLGTRLVFVI